MNTVKYCGQSTEGPSPSLWKDCPVLEMLEDPSVGYYFFDDFTSFADDGANGYATYEDTGVNVQQAAGEVGGALEVSGNDADNDEGSITTGGNTGGFVKISSSGGKKLWFEAKVKKASIADNALAMFLGLSEEGLAAANTLVDDTGEVASKDLVGFQTLHADGDALVFCYRKAGQAKQTISLDGDSDDLTADTYVKVGFKIDPDAPAGKRLTLYVDGVEQVNHGTAANISATTFPDGEELALLWATKVGAAAESKGYLDWWRCAQLR